MRDIYLEDSVIYFPKTDCLYHLKDAESGFEVLLNFYGGQTTQCHYFDVAVGLYILENDELFRFTPPDLSLISNESLPWESEPTPRLPLYLYHQKDRLLLISKLEIYFKEDKSVEIEFTVEQEQYIEPPFEVSNSKLATECAKGITIPIEVGMYPIILHTNKPSIEYLRALFEQFLNYNTPDKLHYQFEMSKSRCFMRAHLMCELFKRMGIESMKVFKKWNPDDWPAISAHRTWSYHCATMVIDSDNTPWVWDPWLYTNHGLLPLNSWLFRKDEPIPVGLLIANRLTLDPLTNGGAAYGTRPFQFPDYLFNEYQAVASDALLNPPTTVCRIDATAIVNRYTFFKSKKTNPIEHENIARPSEHYPTPRTLPVFSSITRLPERSEGPPHLGTVPL